METLQPVARPIGRERAMSDTFSSRPRQALGRELPQNRSNPRRPDENRSASTLPKAFESMLKTTTETGDIGMFSIKPSRVPQSLSTPRRPVGHFSENGLQRPKPAFQPYGVPIVDDRRRLPSYARDAASDVLSMYEAASQKSASRIFEEPDYRSYSMTQTSYSSYTLSNHRSYASLRSQPEGNAGIPNGAVNLLQRPRSPFAYPTRLKRPGFRPSSPALTDGGLVDYSRRAEIERYPYGSGHSTSSPSSLYALKRKPPLGLRPEGNRSTPSLLSQPSPHRRSSSPQVSQSFTGLGQDWSRRNGFASVNTSPARSTLSLASTANLYVSATVASTTTTPGKAPPSSPLYYDYTEDFEVESYNTPAVLGSPPQFTIDKTIPEERPMSAHAPNIGPRILETSHDNGLRISLPLPAKQQRPVHLNIVQGPVTPPTHDVEELSQPPSDQEQHRNTSTVQPDGSKRDTKIVRLSGLGYGARELSTHVEEAFGLSPSAAFEVPVSDAEEATNTDGTTQYPKSAERRQTQSEPLSIPLSEGHSAHQQYSSEPIANQNVAVRDFAIEENARKDICAATPRSRDSTLLEHHSRRPSQESIIRKELPAQAYVSLPRTRVRSSGFSTETGLSELLELITTSGTTSEPRSSGEQPLVLRENTPMISSPFPNESNLRRITSHHSLSPPVSSFNSEIIEDSKDNQRSHQPNRDYNQQRGQRLPPATAARPPSAKAPNFSHQISNNAIARSDPPMLAPKPISPARQLKLKNSIPQLMKALPPLPPEPTFQTDSPPGRRRITEKGLSCRLPPIPAQSASTIRENGNVTSADPPMTLPPIQIEMPHAETSVDGAQPETGHVSSEAVTAEEVESQAPMPPPKMKLKVKSSTALRPLTPSDSSPWDAQENHPLESENTHTPLPQDEKQGNNKRPRFKLRVIRASDSNRGTVRINRNSGDSSKQAARLLQRSPRDLFTPTAGIDNMFRQVSKHIHSRRTSTNSNFFSESEHGSIPSSTPHTLSTTESNPLSPLTAPTSNVANSYETRSAFSDDSSQVEGQNSLRRRLTDFRAKMAVPYVSKLGTHSYDDIVWKDRKGVEHPIPLAARSIPNLHGSRASAEAKPIRRFAEKFHGQRLRTKMQNWLKGARAAIAARMRSRSAS